MKPKTKTTASLAVVGVDIGKEAFHLVGLGTDGTIAFRRMIRPPLRNRWFVDSLLEEAGFEPSVPRSRSSPGRVAGNWVCTGLFAGGSWIRTFGSARDRLRFKPL